MTSLLDWTLVRASLFGRAQGQRRQYLPLLSSVRARTWLEPLAEELQARPGSDARELARMTRQVATSQG